MRINKELGDIWAPWHKTLYLATTTRSKVSLLHDEISRGHCEEINDNKMAARQQYKV